MDAQTLKEKIINDEKVIDILQNLGMHHIKESKNYITCGVPNGDRHNSTVVYKNSLQVEAYTRNIKDPYGNSDIISLVSFINNSYFTESIKWICDVCGYDFYERNQKRPDFLDWLNKHWRILKHGSKNEDEKIRPINERILNYFKPYTNQLFYDDGINFQTQKEFELGYDLYHHAISIPIRDEIGSLVGIKGRLFKKEVKKWESKYFYIEPCAKSKILYGLHKTYPYIKKKKEVIVYEAEKSVMKAWSNGIYNTVAIGSHSLSDSQVSKLTHLGVDIIIAYDSGVEIDSQTGKIDKNFYQNEFDKFLPQQNIYCIYDKSRKILNDKESPIDDYEKWKLLYSDYKFKVRGG